MRHDCIAPSDRPRAMADSVHESRSGRCTTDASPGATEHRYPACPSRRPARGGVHGGARPHQRHRGWEPRVRLAASDTGRRCDRLAALRRRPDPRQPVSVGIARVAPGVRVSERPHGCHVPAPGMVRTIRRQLPGAVVGARGAPAEREEAKARLELLARQGPGPDGFTFQVPFAAARQIGTTAVAGTATG